MVEDSYDTGYSKAPGFKGIKAQSQLNHRYFNEDVGYGLIFLTDLGRYAGVATPCMDALIKLISVVMKRDYKSEKARTMEGLGLSQYSLDELKKVL